MIEHDFYLKKYAWHASFMSRQILFTLKIEHKNTLKAATLVQVCFPPLTNALSVVAETVQYFI